MMNEVLEATLALLKSASGSGYRTTVSILLMVHLAISRRKRKMNFAVEAN